ncbi:MAG: hydroxymethylbilane synthase [Chloroflexota bacterium]|nr:hydroxymethylbilane synthase [Chloroflexota bacterium]
MSQAEIRIGTRGSPLALAQARLVVDALGRAGHSSRLMIVQTDGDRGAPDAVWGEGAFVAALERALIEGHVDVAVHSAKDIPTGEDGRLLIGAYLERADARDALVVRDALVAREGPVAREGRPSGLDLLPAGCRVGTDSPRRAGFLRAHRPDLELHPLHGNVDTRLRRLDDGETDALVLACAGLDRLGLGDRIAERLEPSFLPPAPGQGAVAVQVRRADAAMCALAGELDHLPTRVAVESERAFLAACGGGCRSPIGALATVVGGELELLGGHAHPDGSAARTARRRASLADGVALGRALAAELDWPRPHPATTSARQRPPAACRRVLVTRGAEQAHELLTELGRCGLAGIAVPTIAIELEAAEGELLEAVRRLDTYSWVVLTSANGARAVLLVAATVAARAAARGAGGFSSQESRPRPMPRWAAIGPTTRAALERAGIAVDHQPDRSSAAAMGATLPIVPGDRVLLVRGDLAGAQLADALRARGAAVDDVVGYRTREAPESSRQLLRRALVDGPIDAVVFSSGSTVRGLLRLAAGDWPGVTSLPAICIGPQTAELARRAGFSSVAISPVPQAPALAAAVARLLTPEPQENR